MDIYLLVATLSLLVQVIALVLLTAGYVLKRRTKFRQHGLLMFSAVVLHAILAFAVMVPSFTIIAFTQTNLSLLIVSTVMVHTAFGIISLVLGIWIVGSWRLRASLAYCAPKKSIMRITFILWVIAILIGIIMYFSLYMPLMI